MWQTKPDYFLDAHAASSITETNPDGSFINTPSFVDVADKDGGAEYEEVGSKPQSSAHSPSSVLVYVFCAVAGGVIGAVSVGFVILRHTSAGLSCKYDTIRTPNPSTHLVNS